MTYNIFPRIDHDDIFSLQLRARESSVGAGGEKAVSAIQGRVSLEKCIHPKDALQGCCEGAGAVKVV